MAAQRIENVPDGLYERIERLARVRGQSVEALATAVLAAAVTGSGEDAETALLAEIRTDRDRMAKRGVFITDEDVRRGRHWGRA